MRKIFLVTILVLAATLLAVWSPWNNWNLSFTQLFGVTPPDEMGGLQVSSLAGELEVFIDGDSVGRVSPFDSPLFVPAITPGEHLVSLTRISDVPDAYTRFDRLISFAPGVDVIVAFELGPTDTFSEGHVIFAGKSGAVDDNILLNLSVNTVGASVLVDGIDIGSTPVNGIPLSINRQHDVIVTKSGYDPHEFKLLPESQSDRDSLEGYEINVDVNLFLQPIQVRGNL